jgi:hypothetical protein
MYSLVSLTLAKLALSVLINDTSEVGNIFGLLLASVREASEA